jgi:signal transduction histidine kinase
MYSGIFITALLLLGGSLILGIYHLLLYFQYREKVILAYCLYLIASAAYLAVYLASFYFFYDPGLGILDYCKEATSMLTVLGYTYFIMIALADWHRQYTVFFRAVKWIVIVMLVYCAFVVVAGIFLVKGDIMTTWLPLGTRLVMFVIAFITVKIFFPKMKDQFLRLVKWGSVIYLAIVVLVVTAAAFPQQRLFGIDNMYMFFAGSFIDLVIFSMAMAYKVKSVLMHVMEMRMKISQDLHDDIGASLSSLQIYSTIAERTIGDNPVKAMEMVRKISTQSKLVMDNMSDIVWSMKPAGYGSATLEAKIKNFGTELLRDKNIDLSYAIAPETEAAIQEMRERKNILLVIKEALNNISKYSEATHASLKLYTHEKQVMLEITDNGVGFETGIPSAGNGLRNMQSRIGELGGTIEIGSEKGVGTRIIVSVPITT